MSFTACVTCGHEFTKVGVDIPYADGGVLEVVHGGGQCRACYLADGHKECTCGMVLMRDWGFCPWCGWEGQEAEEES